MTNSVITKLRRQLQKGVIDRRTFVASAIAAGATVPSALSFADNAYAATPKSGGRFRVGVSGGVATDSLDPATFGGEMVYHISFAGFNRLMEISPEGDLIPELAESVEASSDAKTWTFRLREGIEFHDGKALTSEDVIVSLQRHLGDDTESGAKSSLSQIDSFAKDGDLGVVLTLKTGSADFPYVLTDYRLPILPSKDGEIYFENGIGTGGYVLDTFEPGVRAVFVKNPNYWKVGRAHFDEIELIAISDPTARQNAVLNGDIDVAEKISPQTANLLSRSDDVKLLEVKGALHQTFPMRMDVAPFDNLDFRLAVKHAVDREELVQKILKGYGSVGNDHPISSVYEYHADIPQRTQDLDKAKYHMEKSGVGDTAINLSAADTAFTGAVDAAILLQSHLAKAGINLNVVREPNDGYWSNVWGKKPFVASYWRGRPTADWMLTAVYSAGATYNETAWENERFNALLVEARVELDKAKRAEMYAEMQTLIRDDGGALIPSFGSYLTGLRNNVMHDDAVSGVLGHMDGGSAVERWWFA